MLKITFFALLNSFLLAQPTLAQATENKSVAKVNEKSNELIVGMTRCAKINIPMLRLKCFDDLIEKKIKIESKDEPVIGANGKWKIYVKNDPFDDLRTVTLQLNSTDNQEVGMIIRCKEGKKTELFIDWGYRLKEGVRISDYINGIKNIPVTHVVTRTDKEAVVELNLPLSTDKKAVFYENESVSDFIKKLMVANKYLAEVTRSFDPNPYTATFEISGLKNAIKPLIETCPLE